MPGGSPLQRGIAVSFKDLERWDLKSAIAAAFRNAHPDFVPFGRYAEECTEMVRPFDEPEKLWPVYGVNNRGGVFFNHHQKGSEFNASYKRVRRDSFFHNPTRANVGSLGRVPEVEDDAITSPEYQVWRLKDPDWSPDYVEVLLQLPFFLRLVQVHRVGAVKERLYTQNLLQIPVPPHPRDFQQTIVDRWREAKKNVAEARAEASEKERGIALWLYAALGTPRPLVADKAPRCFALPWQEVDRWSYNYIVSSSQGLLGFQKSAFPIVPLGECLVDTGNGYCIKPVGGPTPYRMLKLNALTPAGLDLDKTKYVDVPEKIAKRFSLRKDDLLVCRSNAYEYVGKCALVVEDAPDVLFPDIIIRARLNDSVLTEYVRELVETPLGRSFFQVCSRRAVGGMWKIGAKDIRRFPLPLPPMDKQREIVEQLTKLRREVAIVNEAADRLAEQTKAEIEAMVLGTKKV